MSEENHSEYYKTAIDIVTNPNTDYKAICVAMAKLDPKSFCEMAGVKPWELEARRVYYDEGKVYAIKMIQNATGMTLREANNAIKLLVGKENRDE